MEKPSISILKKYGLQITPVRDKVLQLFLEAESMALSSADIEKNFERIDRITLYRTLRIFKEKGIIVQLVSGRGASKYAYRSEQFTEENKPKDHHAHFHCVQCDKTIALEEIILPDVDTPSGFRVEERHLALLGTCNQCNV